MKTIHGMSATRAIANASSPDAGRRRLLLAGAAGASALAALGTPAFVRAQGAPKIRIGYWLVAAGLPFFAAVEKGYFKEAGLTSRRSSSPARSR